MKNTRTRLNGITGHFAFVALCICATVAALPVSASSMKVLYSFCTQAGCTDGENIGDASALIMDQAGNLYGTTNFGGTKNAGVIFELSPGKNGRYGYNVLYNFCSQTNCADGGYPHGPLIIDTSGNLYGANGGGGKNNFGDVFELLSDGAKWTYNVVYSFCPEPHCLDGSGPFGSMTYSGANAGKAYDGTSPLYGATVSGGDGDFNECEYGCGTVYELQPGQSAWSEQVLYSFCSGIDCPDGSFPQSPVLMDGSGNIYGTTDGGGADGGGVAFKLVPGRSAWSESVLDSFCYGFRCVDGEGPASGLAMNQAGNLVGFLQFGGNQPPPHVRCSGGCGLAYSLSPGKHQSGYGVLYAFCALENCGDGGSPTSDVAASPPVLDSQGDIFGTASVGGAKHRCGTLFELTGSTLQVLYNFGTDKRLGCSPAHGLLRDQAGNLYGMTILEGVNGKGAIFRYQP